MAKKKEARKNGYIVFIVPESGVFLKRGKLIAGDGIGYSDSMFLHIHPSINEARKAKKRRLEYFEQAFSEKHDAKIIKVEYVIV